MGVDLDISYTNYLWAELLWVLAWLLLSQTGKDGILRRYDQDSRVMKSQTLYIIKFTTLTSKLFVTYLGNFLSNS